MRATVFILIAMLFTSCSLFETKEEGIIDKDKFVDVLVDIHFADAVIVVKGYRHTNDSARIDLFYDDVLKKHNISRKELDKTIDFYVKRIDDYDNLYDQVLEKLKIMQSEFNEQKEK